MAETFAYTDVGQVRPTNEDSAAIMPPGVAIVADGMGGYAAGEVASSLLVKTVKQVLGATPQPWDEEVLRGAVMEANTAILNEAAKTPACEGMGTTATLVDYSDGKRAVWAHVGDSRLYLLHGDELHQVTRDHSYVADLVEAGTITPEEARRHPKKNVLTRAVGVEETVKVDAGCFPVERGDVLLLATDGLTNMIGDAEIARLIREHPSDPAYALGAAANDAGGRDNITAVVVVCS